MQKFGKAYARARKPSRSSGETCGGFVPRDGDEASSFV